MKVRYYSIKDVKANEFGELMFAKNDAVAKRIFGKIVSEYPVISSDLQLYCIGEFDNEDGLFANTFGLIADNVVEDNKE